MTSDRSFGPDQDRLLRFSDQVYGGNPAKRTGIDPDLAAAVLRLKRADHVPPFDPSRVAQRKESFMQLVSTAALPPLDTGVAGTLPVRSNGARQAPWSPPAKARGLPTRAMAWVSLVVLIAMLGALGYGVFLWQQGEEPVLPAIQGSPASVESGASWPQFRGNLERTGYTSDPGPGADLNPRWSFTVDESLNGIIQADGKVIGYGADGGLYVLDAGTGEQLWALDLSPKASIDQGRVWLPAIADGTIYVSTQDAVVVAFDLETGDMRWQSALADLVSGAPTVADGIVYVVTGGNELHALDAQTGTEQWSSKLPDRISAQYPTIVDGVYYYPGDSGSVNAIDARNGTPLWKSETISAHRVAAYRDGRLYVPTLGGTMAALDASNGTILWRTDPLPGEAYNPVVTDDAVILAVLGVSTQALDLATGQVLWSLDTPALQSSPHAGGNTLYLNFDGEGTYNAVDLETGALLATVEADGAGSTAAISGDLLFVSGVRGPIRAFGPGDGEATSVQGTIPEGSYIATPVAAAAAAGEQVAPAAPVAGDIQADLIGTFPYPPSLLSLGLFEAPDGTIWRISMGGNIDILDRDGNLLRSVVRGEGSGPGQFDLIYQSPQISWGAISAVWLDDGTVYMTDANNHRVQVFDADGNYLREFGSEGTGDGELMVPVAIARTPAGELVIADIGRHDLQWFDADGDFLRKLAGPEEGKDFVHPVDVTVDTDGNLWVIDHTLAQIFKFDPEGRLIFTVGGRGTGPGQLDEPSDLDIDDQGNVWVADQSNERVQVFDSAGNLLGQVDGCHTDAGCFRRVGIVIAGGNDYLYLSDYDPNFSEDEYIYKFRITSMPEVPIMAAATPAAG